MISARYYYSFLLIIDTFISPIRDTYTYIIVFDYFKNFLLCCQMIFSLSKSISSKTNFLLLSALEFSRDARERTAVNSIAIIAIIFQRSSLILSTFALLIRRGYFHRA